MQKIVSVFLIVLVLAVNGFAATAGKPVVVKILSSGNDVEFDPRTIPAELQQGYLTMKAYCVSCHGQERMITTLRTGISPVTKYPYGETEFRDKIIKIMRSPKSQLDANHAKTLTEFFHYLLTKASIS